MKILVLVTNDIMNDSRVKRVCKTLSSCADVTLFAKRSQYLPDEESSDGYNIRRITGPLYLNKKKKNKLENAPVFKWFFDLRKKIDKYKVKTSGFKIIFEKIKDHDYDNLFEINTEAEKQHIKDVLSENKIFAEEGLILSPEVVYCNDLDTLICGAKLKNKINCKLIYDAHEIFSEQFINKSDAWKSYFFELEKSLIYFADHIIVVNESIGKELVRRYGIKNFTVVPNCARFYEVAEIHQNKIKQILYHGRFEINRGIEELVEAMRYIKGAELILRGDGIIKEKLLEIIKEHKLKRKIIFKDMLPADKVVEESARADIGVIAYIPNCLNNYLCTPNKLFEYIMAGLCVCGSDLPELKNYIVGGAIGGVFDPYKPEDIAYKLNKILNDEKLLNEYKNNSRKLARENLNWEIQEEKIKNILKLCGK